jgi:hypothetical protein
MNKNQLDPFRIMLGGIVAKQDSDLLVELISATGLYFDQSLTKQQAYSHKTRTRELQGRIFAAYDRLAETDALMVANALAIGLQTIPDLLQSTSDKLRHARWVIQDDGLVVSDPDLREMFFPKGSQWDAFVIIRDIFDQAKTTLRLVDAYCDKKVFDYLSARSDRHLTVQILCWKNAPAVKNEAAAFVKQYPKWAIEVRQTNDFHDRFIIIDLTTCVHIGASINGAGNTAFMISKIEDQVNRNALLDVVERAWNSAVNE